MRWKRTEREVAHALGTSRLPNTGRAQPDIIAGPFAIEHKMRTTLPRWLLDALAQARRNARPDQTPIVILTHPRGQGRKPLRLVVLAFEDWVAWHGPLEGTDAKP